MYLFNFKLSLHLLLLPTLGYELKLQNFMWLGHASIDSSGNSWLLLVFWAHKLLHNTILHDCTLRQRKGNS